MTDVKRLTNISGPISVFCPNIGRPFAVHLLSKTLYNNAMEPYIQHTVGMMVHYTSAKRSYKVDRGNLPTSSKEVLGVLFHKFVCMVFKSFLLYVSYIDILYTL